MSQVRCGGANRIEMAGVLLFVGCEKCEGRDGRERGVEFFRVTERYNGK